MHILPNWHPVFVHFTAALLFLAPMLFFLGSISSSKSWGQTFLLLGRWNLWIGTIISLFTVATGLYAFNTVLHNETAHYPMLLHRSWALSTAAVFILLALWNYALYRRNKTHNGAFIIAAMGAACLLAITGYLGGELVFTHGVGVRAVPIESPIVNDQPHEHHHHD